MTLTAPKLTAAEYLAYQDETGLRYELVNGVLVAMGIGTGLHGAIAKFLERAFDAQIAQDWTAQKCSIAIRSPRSGRWDSFRIPDVVVLPLAQWQVMSQREAVIELNEPPPLLVVEVVSESTVSTDYRAKHSEYSVLDILEYWIVDPLNQRVTICRLNAGRYDDAVFTGDEVIQSGVFSGLRLTAAQVLNAK